MSDVTIKDPVKEIPPITRDVTSRRSKWDDVLDRAWALKGKKTKSLPVEFPNSDAASSAARRIRNRVNIHEGDFVVDQRANTVYVTPNPQ